MGGERREKEQRRGGKSASGGASVTVGKQGDELERMRQGSFLSLAAIHAARDLTNVRQFYNANVAVTWSEKQL